MLLVTLTVKNIVISIKYSLTGIAFFLLPQSMVTTKPSMAMKRNWAKVRMVPQAGSS